MACADPEPLERRAVLHVGGMDADGATVACNVYLDGEDVGPCSETLYVPATTAILTLGDGEHWTEDGHPLILDDEGTAWVYSQVTADLSEDAGPVEPWLIGDVEGWWLRAELDWYAHIAGDCTVRIGGGDDGTALLEDIRTVEDVEVFVVPGAPEPGTWSPGAQLSVPDSLWELTDPFPLYVTRDELTGSDGNYTARWSLRDYNHSGASTLHGGIEDGGGDSATTAGWSCTRD